MEDHGQTLASERLQPSPVALTPVFKGMPSLKIRVVQVGYGGVSGIRHVLTELALGLRSKQISSDVFLYQRGIDSGISDAIGIDYEGASSLRTISKKSRADLMQLFKLSLEIDRMPASAVIHHGPVVALTHGIMWRLRRRKGPIPILVHHNPREGLSRLHRIIELSASRLVHVNVVVGSNCLPDPSRLSHRIFASTPIRISNPVGCRSLDRVLINTKNSSIIQVAMVGRMVNQKDFITLIRSVGLANLKGVKIHLSIAGIGPDLAEVTAAADRWGGNAVTIHGELPYQQALSLIATSDIYVQSSRFEADASTSALFAMFNNVPVVVSDVPGIREELKNCQPVPVEVFPLGNAERLAEILTRLAADPTRRTELGMRGKHFVTERNSCEVITEVWLELLESLGDAGQTKV